MEYTITPEQLKKMEKEKIDLDLELNDLLIIETKRKNGTTRIQQDFRFCPTLTEQHSAHLTDLNYLMDKYKPDELAQYIAARTAHRQEILNHDFSVEPNLQEAKNLVYESRMAFEALPPEIKNNFRNHVEFLKFIDNPKNEEQMLRMGILSKKQIDSIKIEDKPNPDATGAKGDTKDDEVRGGREGAKK